MKKDTVIVAIGTTNKIKIQSVKELFQHHFNDVIIKAVKVDSGVKEQPLTEAETYQGAYNRAKAALEHELSAEYGVGIEGGVHQHSFGWFEKTFVVIMNRKGESGVGISAALALPNKISNHLQKGLDLEQAIEAELGLIDVGNDIGMFGLFTKKVVTRSSGIRDAVAFAFARFFPENIY